MEANNMDEEDENVVIQVRQFHQKLISKKTIYCLHKQNDEVICIDTLHFFEI